MKTSWIIGLVLIVVIVGGGVFIFGRSQQTPVPTTTTTEQSKPEQEDKLAENIVEIKNFAYQPASITIKAGETITWTNKDSVGHSATADDGKTFDTGVLSQNESKSVTFDTPGTYNYYCIPHPNIKGVVVVE